MDNEQTTDKIIEHLKNLITSLEHLTTNQSILKTLHDINDEKRNLSNESYNKDETEKSDRDTNEAKKLCNLTMNMIAKFQKIQTPYKTNNDLDLEEIDNDIKKLKFELIELNPTKYLKFFGISDKINTAQTTKTT